MNPQPGDSAIAPSRTFSWEPQPPLWVLALVEVAPALFVSVAWACFLVAARNGNEGLWIVGFYAGVCHVAAGGGWLLTERPKVAGLNVAIHLALTCAFAVAVLLPIYQVCPASTDCSGSAEVSPYETLGFALLYVTTALAIAAPIVSTLLLLRAESRAA